MLSRCQLPGARYHILDVSGHSHNGDDHDLAPGRPDTHVEVDGCEDNSDNDEDQLDDVF
jgi:hypothetical protein